MLVTTSRLVRQFPSALLLGCLRAYKLLLSPFFAGGCRYVPSCSAYASEAVRRHGAVRGIGLAVWRLARCHPLGGQGLDPVPTARRERQDPQSWEA